jgi:hypothetical protein
MDSKMEIAWLKIFSGKVITWLIVIAGFACGCWLDFEVVDGAGVDGAGVDGAGVDGAGVDGAGVDGAGVDGAGVDGAGDIANNDDDPELAE